MSQIEARPKRRGRGMVEVPAITLAHGGGGKAMHDLISDVFVTAFDNEAQRGLGMAMCGGHLTGQNQADAVSFAAEAGMFQNAGVPSVICGPGSIAQAHQPNEFVEISQLEACTEFVRKIAYWAAD